MNWSTLVLGASISVALFIRICFALDTIVPIEDLNDSSSLFSTWKLDWDQDIDTLLTGTADEVYEKFLKYTLLRSLVKNKHIEDQVKAQVNEIADTWLQELKLVKLRPLSKLDAASNGRIFENTKTFNDEICGNSKPPTDTCNTPNCHRDIRELPEKCEYDEKERVLECKNSDIQNVPPLPPELKILDLNATTLESISANEIHNVSIEQIRLFDNKLNYIHPWAFHQVENLMSLHIIGNEIDYVAYEMYVGLNETVMLDLQNNKISFKIFQQCPIRNDNDILPVLPNLRILTLSNNPLGVIPKQMFYGLKNSPVTTLYLDNCYLEHIDREALIHFKSLKILNLSGNPRLSQSLKEIIDQVPAIEKLYLKDLGLLHFPTDDLAAAAESIVYLDLSNSKFYSVDWEDLSHFPNLEDLYLDDCQIVEISPNAFAGNTKLKKLSIQNNPIREIPQYFPPSLTVLRFISTVNTAFTNFDFSSLQNLTKLATLQLSGVPVKGVLDSTTFAQCHLQSLEQLFVTNSDISRIEDKAFDGLKKLKHMSLENNPLSIITPGAFSGLDTLESLDLTNCKLSFPVEDEETYEGPFQSLQAIKSLYLSRNRIAHIPNKLFEKLGNLRFVNLADNPVEPWTTRIFKHLEIKLQKEEEPPTFQLDLRNGNIQFFTEAMIQDFYHMFKVDMSNNKLTCNEYSCQLRDMMINQLESTIKPQWIGGGFYKCSDSKSQKSYDVLTIPDSACISNNISETTTTASTTTTTTTEDAQDPTDNEDHDDQVTATEDPGESNTSSSGIVIIIVIAACVTLVVAVALILAYKNRAHLRYFLFSVKLNVTPAAPRKAKLSTVECESGGDNYDYDVFISYHHEDSEFIEREFLPEIELQEPPADDADRESVYEVKNLVYTIENDSIGKNASRNMRRGGKKFRVCLHERDFAVGVPITENIVDCVDRSKKTVIFVSKQYMTSQWCSFELNLAYHRMVESRRKSFVLVLLEDIPTDFRTKVLNYLMVSKTHLQWPGHAGSPEDKSIFWRKLRNFLDSR